MKAQFLTLLWTLTIKLYFVVISKMKYLIVRSIFFSYCYFCIILQRLSILSYLGTTASAHASRPLCNTSYVRLSCWRFVAILFFDSLSSLHILVSEMVSFGNISHSRSLDSSKFAANYIGD